MNTSKWSGVLFVIGCIAIVVGAFDPLEGSIVILAGSAVALGSVLIGRSPRPVVVYWLWTFVLIGAGVGAMFAWSSVGGPRRTHRPLPVVGTDDSAVSVRVADGRAGNRAEDYRRMEDAAPRGGIAHASCEWQPAGPSTGAIT